jgi:pimeloyl-ACP methyl ester carboxylesterase
LPPSTPRFHRPKWPAGATGHERGGGTGNGPETLVADYEARARRVDTPCVGGTIAWRVWGEGEPLVVGHGGQGAWSHWIRNIDSLSAERMLIAVDMPGHGDSAMPEPVDHRGISAALAGGLREILGGRKVDLAGFSFGGCSFAHFAAYYPELARRLVLIGTGGLDTPHGHVNLGRVAGLQGEERKAMLKSNLLGLMLHHPESADALAQHLLWSNARKARLHQVPELVIPDRWRRSCRSARPGRRDLGRVRPAASRPGGAGSGDPPHPSELRFRVIADAGHWAMYERPEAFNAALLDMLRQPLRQGLRRLP